ncbi:PTS sugar transporter subunit IIA [Georgenia faecalis]|uniref:PTS glucose transporter subunit IIA n=1 Tax=Georgenia faecalis TaxID=2483799 RepID=A0ABV9DBT6_9MICO|nr:PTS glucose transporter subunit IIA [Georgenia faecalis]
MTLTVLAPLSGTVVAMADVPDPVFAGSLVGPGVAIDPERSGPVDVVAPVAGTIVKLHPHAFVILTDEGKGVLVHLGLDTVQLEGAGFTLHAAEKDVVEVGQKLVTWDPAEIEAGGRSPVCPVVGLEGSAEAVRLSVEPGATVRAADALLTWA